MRLKPCTTKPDTLRRGDEMTTFRVGRRAATSVSWLFGVACGAGQGHTGDGSGSDSGGHGCGTGSKFSDAAVAVFAHFEDSDSTELARATCQLSMEAVAHGDLNDEDVQARRLDRDLLDLASVGGIPRPSAAIDLATAISLPWLSRHAVIEHDRIALEVDQVGLDPYATYYARTFDSGADCYPSGCEFLRSTNVVEAADPMMTYTFSLRQDWRAFVLSDGSAARASRSWLETAATTTGGSGQLEQYYADEVWVEAEDLTTVRVASIWAARSHPSTDEGGMEVVRLVQMDSLFATHDEWLSVVDAI